MVQARLDPVFGSTEWIQTFSLMVNYHLPFLRLDHTPLWIQLHQPGPKRLGSPTFRFQNVWLTHPGFDEMVATHWLPEEESMSKLVARFSQQLTSWNQSDFGNIFHRKKRLLARLQDIQRVMTEDNLDSLLALEEHLSGELMQALSEEEIFWHQKARCE